MRPPTESTIPFVRFDSGNVQPGERMGYWHASLANVCTLSFPEGMSAETFEAQNDMWMLGSMMLSRRTCSPHILHRSSQSIRSDQIDHYKIHLRVDTAAATHLQAGQYEATKRHVEVGIRQCVMTDLARPELVRVDRGSTINVVVPRDQLDALLPRPVDLHGTVLSGPCSVLLADYLHSLSESLSHMSVEQLPDVTRATLHLLAASLAPSMDTLALAGPAVDMTLRRQIKRFIEAELTRADISATRICARFHISRSTLYRLFEPMGGVARYIRERRLMRIHALLVTSEGRPHLQRLAEDHGFNTPAHFSRAFREQFGYAPSELVARGPRPGAAPGIVSPGNSLERWLHSLRSG